MTPQDKLAVANALTQLAYTTEDESLKEAATKRAFALLTHLADLPTQMEGAPPVNSMFEK